jgi:hypothetical protein
MLETVYCFECMYFETELKMLETVYCFRVSKSELIECMYFQTEHCLAAASVSAIVACCCRDSLSYTVSEQPLLWVVIYFVCVNFRKFIQSLMSSKPVSAACLCCLLSSACAAANPPVAVVVAARVNRTAHGE